MGSREHSTQLENQNPPTTTELAEQTQAAIARQAYEKPSNPKQPDQTDSTDRGTNQIKVEDWLPLSRRTANSIVVDGEERSYDFYVPKSYDANKKTPVFLVLHGTHYGDASGVMEQLTDIDQQAEKQGFIVVYPYAKVRPLANNVLDATGLSTIENLLPNSMHLNTDNMLEVAAWNTDSANILPNEPSYNDVKYLDTVLKDVQKQLNVDAERIVAFGHSSGGMMVQQYARERPGVLAGIASVNGTIIETTAKPQTGLPILILTGDKDRTLPYDGGSGLVSWFGSFVFSGLKDSKPYEQKHFWSDVNGCTGKPSSAQEGEVEITSYSAEQCKDGPVTEYKIKNSGHKYSPEIEMGKNVETSDLIVSFLLENSTTNRPRLPRPVETTAVLNLAETDNL